MSKVTAVHHVAKQNIERETVHSVAAGVAAEAVRRRHFTRPGAVPFLIVERVIGVDLEMSVWTQAAIGVWMSALDVTWHVAGVPLNVAVPKQYLHPRHARRGRRTAAAASR